MKTLNVFCFLRKIIKDKIRQARTAKLNLRKNMNNYKKDLLFFQLNVALKADPQAATTKVCNLTNREEVFFLQIPFLNIKP